MCDWGSSGTDWNRNRAYTTTTIWQEWTKLIGWAEKYGLYVFLDMHQDLYSCKYSDGAPEWATLTDERPHITEGNMVWSDAYITSPAIQRAFDNFWANTPASDGVGIQEHYARAWRHVAKRYAGQYYRDRL